MKGAFEVQTRFTFFQQTRILPTAESRLSQNIAKCKNSTKVYTANNDTGKVAHKSHFASWRQDENGSVFVFNMFEIMMSHYLMVSLVFEQPCPDLCFFGVVLGGKNPNNQINMVLTFMGDRLNFTLERFLKSTSS